MYISSKSRFSTTPARGNSYIPNPFAQSDKTRNEEKPKGEGIQGRNNSCYVDSTLMALFFYPVKIIDKVFLIKTKTSESAENKSSNEVHLRLKGLVGKLRQNKFCSAAEVDVLRNALSKVNPKLKLGEMMDVVDLISTLCGKQGLNLPPFLTYQGTSNYYHQIQLKSDGASTEGFRDLRALFMESLEQQKLKITEITGGILLIKMPRSNGKLIKYKGIVPQLYLELPGCPSRLKLHAVICIRHCHYTCFILSPEGKWVFFDSMAKALTPEISNADVVSTALTDVNPASLSDLEKNRDKNLLHLITDIHLCVYVREKQKLSSTTPSSISEEEGYPDKKTNLPQDVQVTGTETGKSLPQPFVTPIKLPNVLARAKSVDERISANTGVIPKKPSAVDNPFPNGESKVVSQRSISPKVEIFPVKSKEMVEISPSNNVILPELRVVACLQYVLWAHTEIFDKHLENVKKADLLKLVKDVFVKPFRAKRDCFDIPKDKEAQVGGYFNASSSPDIVNVLDCTGFEGMILLTAFGSRKDLYHKLSSAVKTPNGTLLSMSTALKMSTRDSKFKDLPTPALIIVKDKKTAKVFPDFHLGFGQCADNLHGKFLRLQSVICKTEAERGSYSYAAYTAAKEGTESTFMLFDSANGSEKELPELYKTLAYARTPVVPSDTTMSTMIKNEHVRKMYEDGVLWIYV